jgi:hypothetical protein
MKNRKKNYFDFIELGVYAADIGIAQSKKSTLSWKTCMRNKCADECRGMQRHCVAHGHCLLHRK